MRRALARGEEASLGGSPQKLRPYHEAMIKEQLRRRASGRHAARPGETLVSSGHDIKSVATKPSEQFVFRGNQPPREKGSLWFGSRHPDVAGNYAVAGTARQEVRLRSPRNQKVYAFKRNQMDPISEGPEYAFVPPGQGTTPEDNKRYADYFKSHASQRKSLRSVETAGMGQSHTLPTFEMVFQQPRPSPVGVYSARQSRTAEGDPALAFRPIGKRSRRDVFEGTSKS